MTEPILCELCLAPAQSRGLSSGSNKRLACSWCGNYTVSDRWCAARMKHSIEELGRTRLRGVVRQDTDSHDECREVITTDNWERIAARHDQPRDSLEQMERLLAILAERTPFFGGASLVDSWSAMAVRLYLPRGLQEKWGTLVQALADDGYVKRHAEVVTLTHKGWVAAQVARRTTRAGNQAFIAMWFHGEMNCLFDEALQPALRACGYAPYRVDREQHNNKIDDEIIANIRKSRIFVGDLTGMRPNVFYEAGFANGLGIPVLLTCNESYSGSFVAAVPDAATDPSVERKPWFKQVADSAFDVRQYLIVPWSTPADLATKLENRIRALGLALT